MDSTMVYQLIQQQLDNPKELANLLPTLASLLAPRTRIATNRMNQQQIFAQVYSCLSSTLDRTQEEREQLLTQVPEGEQEESVEEEVGEGEGEDDHIDEEQIDEEEQNQGAEGDEVDMEDEEGLEELAEDAEGEEGEEDEDEYKDLMEEEAYEGEEDVGLYGEDLDEEDMEDYENEGDSAEQREFEEEDKLLAKKTGKAKAGKEQQDDQGDDLINDQFDHFRELQLKNNEEETKGADQTDLEKQIARLQGNVIDKKGWVLKGEVKGTQRPVNSLLEYDLQFNTGIRLNQQITPEYNDDLQKIIKQRILDELYDDRVRYQPAQALREQFGSLKQVSREKSQQGLAELYEADFKNFLGLGQNKQDKLKASILEAFKEVNYYLDSLSNFHFTPRPTGSSRSEAVISEQKVPTFRNTAGEKAAQTQRKFVSQKQEDNKGKRLKNKRIARQRVKEQMKKKLNKKIEYGGVTKFEAKAMAKKAKNNLNPTNIKYSKSANFFGEMNKDKSKKPNPNISKLKV